MIYKVSYVVQDGRLPGSIKNETERPVVGAMVKLGPNLFQIVDVVEIMPTREDFLYLHVTVASVAETEPSH